MTRIRIGLEWKAGALLASLAAGIILAGIAAVWLRMGQLAGPALESALLRAGDQVDDAVKARLDRLDLITRLMVNDPPFRAYAAEGHLPSLADNLQDRRALYALDGFVLADPQGKTLVDTRATGEPTRPEAPAQGVLVEALAGRPARGLWIEADGALFLAAAAPLPAGEVAAIVALESVGGALVGEWRRMTGAELVFFAGVSRRNLPGASTLALSRSELTKLLESEALATGAAPHRIEADGEEFVARSTLLSSEGEPAAGFVALRSVDRELAAFRKIQAALLAVGLVAIPLTLVLGALLGRRVTRPIAALVRATERVRAGDYDAPLPPETPDELGALAGAFRTLVAQLKQKEEMDAWIGALVARVGGTRVQDRPAVAADRPAAAAAPDSDVSTQSIAPVPPQGPAPGPAASREPARPIEAGMLLQDRFRILARLGAGGMGEVWKARDERLGEVIALKFLPAKVMADQPERVERFRQEIRLARRITHRNVVRTHELLELPDGWALLMEHVDGVPLQRLLAAGRLPAAAGLRIARQICDGLEAAHAQGVIHRDLKPGNVLIDSGGGVKIADFGLARAADAGDEPRPTLEGSVLGTPHYMSPEQVRGRPVDRRADIYSAGVMFYELLCGRLPFDGDSALALLRAHADAAPPPPRSINPAMSAELEAVLLKALEKDPAKRFASARELSEALGRASESGAAA